MLNPNHPDDERLSALASGDTDATADASLTDHVASCTRCTDLVDELGALRASLADLPDLEPSRPLSLVPPVEEERGSVDRLGGWARRFFGPALTAGAALAMIGLVGTAAPALQGGAQSAAPDDAQVFEFDEASDGAEAGAGGAAAPAAEEAAPTSERAVGADVPAASEGVDELSGSAAQDDASGDTAADSSGTLPAERSLWPMVLFTGVALMIAAALLRWILVPRAG